MRKYLLPMQLLCLSVLPPARAHSSMQCTGNQNRGRVIACSTHTFGASLLVLILVWVRMLCFYCSVFLLKFYSNVILCPLTQAKEMATRVPASSTSSTGNGFLLTACLHQLSVAVRGGFWCVRSRVNGVITFAFAYLILFIF